MNRRLISKCDRGTKTYFYWNCWSRQNYVGRLDCAHQAYLIKGQPGSGKTTLGFHFLNAGIPDKVIEILKKRVSDFERTPREFKITQYGIKVGKPLTNLRGILNGISKWTSKQ